MDTKLKLYMILLGCKPDGRFTEQHDIFLGIGSSLKELVPQMKAFWPEAKGKIHIDAWREVTAVNNFHIKVIPRASLSEETPERLFFLNLGGYKQNEFEEYHYKMLAVTKTLGLATKKSKTTAFYKHCGFKGAESHLDEKYGVDVDDLYRVDDMLPAASKLLYGLEITKAESTLEEDILHIGYVKIGSLK